MDKNYTKGELLLKSVVELKQILRNRQLKVSGSKLELVDRILNDQSSSNIKPTAKSDKNYFDYLPKDINKMVNKYRMENEPNNKIAYSLLGDILNDFSVNSTSVKRRNSFLEGIGMPYKIVKNKAREEKENEYQDRISNLDPPLNPSGYDQRSHHIMNEIGYYNIPFNSIETIQDTIVTDEMLSKFILYLLTKERIDINHINKLLDTNGSNMRVIKIPIGPKVGQKRERFRYFVGYFNSLESADS